MSSNPKNPTIFQPLTDSHIHHKYSKKPRVSLEFPPDGMTKQSFKDECDVNRIIARFQATGELPNVNTMPPQYLDVTAMDFQEHQNFIAGAFSMFHELPAKIRDKFENDPGAFFDFCSQEKNRPELAEMGLLRADLPPVVPLTSITPGEAPKTPPTPSPQSPVPGV